MSQGVKLLATVEVIASEDLYKIVDLLNRTLKYNNLMFGLAKAEEENKMIFSIYNT